MMNQRYIENFIRDASEVKTHVEALEASVVQLRSLLTHEHEAVRASELVTIEELTREKVRIGNEIARTYDSLQAVSQRVRSTYERVTGQHAAPDLNLTQVMTWLEAAAAQCSVDGFDGQILRHIVTRLAEQLAAFRTLHSEVKPKIEINVYLTRRLLENHWQTIKFWQDILAESEATYTPSGVARKTPEGAPSLRVKA